jgi:hypothetical protein
LVQRLSDGDCRHLETTVRAAFYALILLGLVSAATIALVSIVSMASDLRRECPQIPGVIDASGRCPP